MSAVRETACRQWRGPLVEAVFGELDDARRHALESHLASCESCRRQLAGFEQATATVRDAMPEKPRSGELDAWQRLAPELDAIDRARKTGPARQSPGRGLRLGYPAAAALAAALLLLGLGLGQLVRAPLEPTSAPDVASSPTADAELAYARYLERSTPLLLAVANRQVAGPATASFDPGAERRLAERLAHEATDLVSELEDRGLRRQAALLRDLEIVFLQLANLPDQQYGHGLQVVQATLESRALLFQLSVEEMRRL